MPVAMEALSTPEEMFSQCAGVDAPVDDFCASIEQPSRYDWINALPVAAAIMQVDANGHVTSLAMNASLHATLELHGDGEQHCLSQELIGAFAASDKQTQTHQLQLETGLGHRFLTLNFSRLPPGSDRKSTRLNSSHTDISRMPSSA